MIDFLVDNWKLLVEVSVFVISFNVAQVLSIHWHKKRDIKWHETVFCFAVLLIPTYITSNILSRF